MNKIEDLLARKDAIRSGGGEAAIASQHDKGKYTARERINMLLDPGSFVEMDVFVEHRQTQFGMLSKKVPGEGVVTGYGTIDGRAVAIFSQDFTVLGGSLGEKHADKIVKVQELALSNGMPIIGINDSGGARVQEGIDSLAGFGKIFKNNVDSSGVIPQISVILGPSAGGATYSPALTDFIFMVEGISKMFITGPDVIKTVTGEQVDQESLGGARTHNEKSGVAHYIDSSEEACFARIREILSFLPQNNLEKAPIKVSGDDINRLDESMNTIVPENVNKAYDIVEVIKILADDAHFVEYQPLFAKNMVCGFIRMNGKSIGVIANQPKVLGGCLDIDASDKAARFIRTCDAFNISILTLEDVPGFLPGTKQEYGGIIRHGAKMLYAYSEATVPMVTIILRKAFGGAYIGMSSKHLGADFVYAWPSAQIAVMGASGAANIVFRKEIKEAEDPETKRAEKIREYEETVSNPYIAGARGYIDDVIVPEQTRKYVISAFEILQNKRKVRPSRKHGNIPL